MTQSLLDILCIGPAEVVAAVGAGGKTTFLEKLAQAYEAEGSRAVLATTTKVRAPAAGDRPLVLGDDLDTLLAALGTAPPMSPVVGRRMLPGGKVEGVPPEWIAALRDLPWAAAVLVEADGSLGRPLKAPAEWEPVIPHCASLVVAFAGLDAQGAPLDDEHVHRPELVARLLDMEGDGGPAAGPEPDAVLEPDAGDGAQAGGGQPSARESGGPSAGRLVPAAGLLTVLLRGYRGMSPATARFLAVLGKADVAAPAPELRRAARDAPVEVWTWSAPGERLHCLRRRDRLPAAVVLAAGRGKRMGGPKLTAPVGGETVLGRVLRAAAQAGVFSPVILVVGGEVTPAGAPAGGVPGTTGLVTLRNPRPEDGMASSLKLGVGALAEPAHLAVLLADQPLVSSATLVRLAEARAAAPRAAAAALAGEAGPAPPLILHRSLLPQLLELQGDRGARDLLRRFAGDVVTVPADAEEGLDVDTAEDLDRARRLLERRAREE